MLFPDGLAQAMLKVAQIDASLMAGEHISQEAANWHATIAAS